MAANVAVMDQEELLMLIVRQLQYYGMNSIASVVADAGGVPNRVDPSPKLAQLAASGMLHQNTETETTANNTENNGPNLDLDDVTKLAAKISSPRFTTIFMATHKGACRSACFSVDGRLVATGSADTTLKVLDVAKMNLRVENAEERPVVRTLYDHTGPVNDLAFHPNGMILASCSKDCTIKFFDLTRASIKHAFRFIKDPCNVRSISFHPSGDYLLAGTDNDVIRLYDVSNFSSFCTPNLADSHRGPINQVIFSPSGHAYASCSKDGSWKLWDTVTSTCLLTLQNAHMAAEVSSVRVSNNGKYVLTSGKDSYVRLWDQASGKNVRVYEGARQQHLRAQAAFMFEEDFIISSDEVSNNIMIWDARSVAPLNRLSGHSAPVRCVAPSPTSTSFMSCSEDCRVMFWNMVPPNES